MRRRELITLLGSMLAWPLAVHSQQSPVPVVGYLTAGTPEVSVNAVKAFLEGLGEIGFVEGRNVTIEYRWAQNDRARLPELVADLVSRHVAVIATPGSVPAAARTTFVSGAFCGGWIWRRVADRLEQGGHKVFAPSLTGLGERSHLLTKDVNLDTHIADVVNLIQWESLENVRPVAWSYAGFVSSGALESIGDRVSSVLWLDAFIPADGQKVADFAAEGVRKSIQAAVDNGEAGVRGLTKISTAAIVAEPDRAFAESKATPHPVGTYLQQIKDLL